MPQRVSDHEFEHILRHNRSDPPEGRGSIIPALALDLRDSRAANAALKVRLAAVEGVVEAAHVWQDTHETYIVSNGIALRGIEKRRAEAALCAALRAQSDATAKLGEEYPKQQKRMRELLRQYEIIGPSGTFGAAMLRATMREADEAAISGDLVRMLRAFAAMKDHK